MRWEMLTKFIVVIILQSISQIITLYTLNLYSALCQLYTSLTHVQKKLEK